MLCNPERGDVRRQDRDRRGLRKFELCDTWQPGSIDAIKYGGDGKEQMEENKTKSRGSLQGSGDVDGGQR